MDYKKGSVNRDYTHIGKLSDEFAEQDTSQWSPEDAAWWQVRVLLAIAQQLSVISANLKDLKLKEGELR